MTFPPAWRPTLSALATAKVAVHSWTGEGPQSRALVSSPQSRSHFVRLKVEASPVGRTFYGGPAAAPEDVPLAVGSTFALVRKKLPVTVR